MFTADWQEEASLNAQALRRQVADTQRLAVECKTLTKEVDSLTQECIRLEKECNLYHNDREVFMEAADEAEDRAAQAEERAEEANRRVEELLLELENIRRCSPQKYPATPEVTFKIACFLRYVVKEILIELYNKKCQGASQICIQT